MRMVEARGYDFVGGREKSRGNEQPSQLRRYNHQKTSSAGTTRHNKGRVTDVRETAEAAFSASAALGVHSRVVSRRAFRDWAGQNVPLPVRQLVRPLIKPAAHT